MRVEIKYELPIGDHRIMIDGWRDRIGSLTIVDVRGVAAVAGRLIDVRIVDDRSVALVIESDMSDRPIRFSRVAPAGHPRSTGLSLPELDDAPADDDRRKT